MAKKSYSEKLLDPRWQKKRLEIMQRDGFKCFYCGDATLTLHVHHQMYMGPNPWDTPAECLITLCKDCHAIEHFNYTPLERELLDIIRYRDRHNTELAKMFNNLIRRHKS